MGSNEHYPEEAPTHQVRVGRLRHQSVRGDEPRVRRLRGRHRLSDRRRTAARPGGLSGHPGGEPGARVDGVRADPGPVDLRHLSQWWRWKPGASWQHPLGPRSTLAKLADHPVVHVAHEDAAAYASLGGWVAADRGAVGVRRPRRSGRPAVHLGRRGPAGRADHGQHLGRTGLPVAIDRGVGLAPDGAGRQLPGQRVRVVRHGRQRVGVDAGLVDRRSIPPTPRHRAARRRTRGAGTSGGASTRRSRSSPSRARWSRAARTCVRTATASATGRRPAGLSRSTPG